MVTFTTRATSTFYIRFSRSAIGARCVPIVILSVAPVYATRTPENRVRHSRETASFHNHTELPCSLILLARETGRSLFSPLRAQRWPLLIHVTYVCMYVQYGIILISSWNYLGNCPSHGRMCVQFASLCSTNQEFISLVSLRLKRQRPYIVRATRIYRRPRDLHEIFPFSLSFFFYIGEIKNGVSNI